MNKRWEGLPIVVFGIGGISKEVVRVIELINHEYPFTYKLLGYIAENKSDVGAVVSDIKVIGTDETISELIDKFGLIGAVLPIGSPNVKKKIFKKFENYSNLCYPNIVAPDVCIHKSILEKMGYGNIITPGVQMTIDVKIGNFNLFNLNTTIGHDAVIGDYNVVNPGVTISGNVIINNEILIGTGANILQGLQISDNVIVGGGALVNKNIDERGTYVGVPAKRIK